MSLGVGTQRLTNRKRAQQVPTRGKPVFPQVNPANLPAPILGGEVDFVKEFEAPQADDILIKTTAKERDFISTKSSRQKEKVPIYEIADIDFTIFSHEELEKVAVC